MTTRLSGGTWTGLTVMLLGAAMFAAQSAVPARASIAPPPNESPATTVAPSATTARPTAPGGASASAAVLGIAPQVSNLTLAVTFGQSLAAYLQNEAQASAQTVNLGGVGDLVVNTPVCGATVLKPDQLPMPLTASSTTGTGQKTTGATFGVETVSVSRVPEDASATTNVVDLSVPDLLTVTATTTSSVHFVADGYQEADASVTEKVDILNGLVQLDGLTWTSKQRVGTSPVSQSTFTMGPVTLAAGAAPVTLPSTDSIATVLNAVNSITGMIGLKVEVPLVTSGPGPQTTTVGPLDLHFSGSSLDNSIVSPANKPVTQLEQILANEGNIGNTDCNLGASFYSADSGVNIVLGALEGSGAVDVDLGGATAMTQPAGAYTNPFGGGAGPSGAATGASGGSPLPPAGGGLPLSGTGPSVAIGPLAGPSGRGAGSGAGSTGTPTVPAAVTTGACETTSPAGIPGCWNGVGPIAAGAVVVFGAALVAVDLRRSRRIRRRYGSRSVSP